MGKIKQQLVLSVKYGIATGLFITIFLLFCHLLKFEGHWLVLILPNVLFAYGIYIGIKDYRNNKLGGFISFAKAFSTGAFITFFVAVITLIYFLFFYFSTINVNDYQLKQEMIEKGISQEQINMRMLFDKYAPSIIVSSITFIGRIFIGLIFSLFLSMILKKDVNINPGIPQA